MKKKKKWGGIILLVVGSVVVLVLLASNYISNRIKSEIDSALRDPSVYRELDVDVFQRKIHFSDLNYEQGGRTFSMPEIFLKGFSYYQYVINGKLIFDAIEIHDPEITIITSDENKQKENEKNENGFKRNIGIKNILVSNGVLKMKKTDSAKNEIFFRFPNLEVDDIKIDSTTRDKTVPFKYGRYSLEGDSLSITMNPEHYISAGALHFVNNEAEVKNFRIVPYDDRASFDRKIPYEKDRISLQVDRVQLDSLSFEYRQDTLYLSNPVMSITGGELQIYRNKSLPDDPRVKPLYSKMLRKSPVKLSFDKVVVKNSIIVYEEKVKPERTPAKISFNEVNGEIQNLVNTKNGRKELPRTQINAEALFMGKSPVKIDWSFNAANMYDKFLFSGNFGTLNGEMMNSFLKPSMGMEAEGKLNTVAFTFTGNDDVLTGDVLVDYDQFKINIMKDNGRKKSKLLSAIANLFIDNNGLSEKNSRKEVRVERNKNRSFWNYVWSGLKKGVIDALVQLK